MENSYQIKSEIDIEETKIVIDEQIMEDSDEIKSEIDIEERKIVIEEQNMEDSDEIKTEIDIEETKIVIDEPMNDSHLESEEIKSVESLTVNMNDDQGKKSYDKLPIFILCVSLSQLPLPCSRD